jgi:hypothetical protein
MYVLTSVTRYTNYMHRYNLLRRDYERMYRFEKCDIGPHIDEQL